MMKQGDDLSWNDGAEEYLSSIFLTNTDLSTASDQLASHIKDWPTQYHLDRRRTNLLRPLRLGPNTRVLDVGAGTGVMSRYVAETGASVLAVEGDPTRAELASTRCEGTSVEVRCGSIQKIDDSDGFDVVLAIGVLEYATGQAGGAVDFLGQLADLVRPGGVLVIAIENQFGLAYLLGANEDHLSQPWIGLEGYPTGEAGVRTFSRKKLNFLLKGVGLSEQKWFYPFPDYKLPIAILSENTYREPDVVDLVDQLAGSPIAPERMGETAGADTRAVHRELLEAGMGPEIANSFLVVAATDQAALENRTNQDVLAWRFTGDRLRCYLGERRIRTNNGVRQIDRLRSYSRETIPKSWLIHQGEDPLTDNYLTGPTLEQSALSRLRSKDVDGLKRLLNDFHAWITPQLTKPTAETEPHPYLPTYIEKIAPGYCIDAGFDNLVPNGTSLQLVDKEWQIETGVDPELAIIRTLWKLASTIILSSTKHPWPSNTTVDELTLILCGLYPLPISPKPLERFYKAEAELLTVVCGGSPSEHEQSLKTAGQRSNKNLENESKLLDKLRSRFAWLKNLPGGHVLAKITRRR